MYKKLRGRIVEKYDTQQNFAKEIGLSMQSVSRKMRGASGFSQKDIITWCEALDIDLKDAGLYFLCCESSKV